MSKTGTNKAWYTIDQFKETCFGDTVSKGCILKWIKEGTVPSEKMSERKLFIPAWFVQEVLAKGLNKEKGA
jgi:hypothetical protein